MWQFVRNAFQRKSILNTEQKDKTSWAVLPGLALSTRLSLGCLGSFSGCQSQTKSYPDQSTLGHPGSGGFVQISLPGENPISHIRANWPTNLWKTRERLTQIFYCSANYRKETDNLITSWRICPFSIFLPRCSGLEPFSWAGYEHG